MYAILICGQGPGCWFTDIISLALPPPNTSVLIFHSFSAQYIIFPRCLSVRVSLGYEPRAPRVGNPSLVRAHLSISEPSSEPICVTFPAFFSLLLTQPFYYYGNSVTCYLNFEGRPPY
jgi:hypothetical protein